jgi:dihydrofolate reductase
LVTESGQDYGYSEFYETVDTVIMGRKTYDWVMTQVDEFPHAGKETYIITRTPQAKINNTTFYNGDINTLIENLKSKTGRNIFIDGGAEIVHLLLQHKLIDELIISVIPILLGEGIRLFKTGFPEQKLELLETKSFKKGLVQLHYKIIKEK